MTRKIRPMSPEAARHVREAIERYNIPVLSPEELEVARANPDIDDDLGPPKMGRPKKGEQARPTATKSVKHTVAFWVALEKKAQARGMSVHEAMREALAQWLKAS
jgi:hypothetical protein